MNGNTKPRDGAEQNELRAVLVFSGWKRFSLFFFRGETPASVSITSLSKEKIRFRIVDIKADDSTLFLPGNTRGKRRSASDKSLTSRRNREILTDSRMYFAIILLYQNLRPNIGIANIQERG